MRSLVTLATIEAAATDAVTWSPFHTARAGTRQPADREAVGEHVTGPLAQPGQRPAHARHVAHVQPARVDLLGGMTTTFQSSAQRMMSR